MARRTATRLTRVEAKQRTREKLLAAAGDVFAAQGFTAATVEEIVERAGFTRGAFYANFADKADAFLTLLEETRRADMHAAAELVATTPDDQKLQQMQAWYDSLRDPRWERADAEFGPHAAADPALRARLAARQREVRDAIAAILRAYIESTPITLSVSPDVVASMILAIGEGVARQRQLEPDTTDPDLFTTTVAYVWFGLVSGSS